MIHNLTVWLEFLQGARDDVPPGLPPRYRWLLVALWWTALAALVAMFSGQASKFIYIDF
jgi:hypothetical protein